MSLEVLYEDNHIIGVNKRPSYLVQGDKTGDKPLVDIVKEYIKEKYNKPGDVFLGVVHRIDRPVSGVVVFAKTSKALVRLNKMFQDKEIQKTYWTVTRDMPPKEKDKITHFLVRKPKKNKSFAHDKIVPDSKESSLTYDLKGKSDNFYFLEITPHTGRHHQIRSQLSKIGCPIKGDLKYGSKRSNKNASIHLHARKIVFLHPVKKEPIEIKANPPKDVLWDEFLKL
jgi:23S rRNA pseudouridine1911/1915/1917 synthase